MIESIDSSESRGKGRRSGDRRTGWDRRSDDLDRRHGQRRKVEKPVARNVRSGTDRRKKAARRSGETRRSRAERRSVPDRRTSGWNALTGDGD